MNSAYLKYKLQTFNVFRTKLRMLTEKEKKICRFGHTFYKSSDCPTCPICGKIKDQTAGFLALLSTPARNTLLHHEIDTIEKLAAFSEKEILALHGMGKASLPVLKKALHEADLSFKKPQ